MSTVNKQLLDALEKISRMTMSMYLNAHEAMRDAKRIAHEAIAAAEQAQAVACNHRIADARNAVVSSGYVCVDCGALFSAADHSQPAMADRDAIRRVFMAHGFTIKDGQTDLKPYVYEAAEALLRELSPAVAVPDDLKAAALKEAEDELCQIGMLLTEEGWDTFTIARTLDVVRIALYGGDGNGHGIEAFPAAVKALHDLRAEEAAQAAAQKGGDHD